MDNLLSFVTGKFSIWIMAGLLTVIIGLNGYIYILKSDAQVELAEKKGIEQALSFQSSLIESNRVDYEENLEVANEKKEVVRTEYKTKIQIIEKVRETNATCEIASEYLNNYVY